LSFTSIFQSLSAVLRGLTCLHENFPSVQYLTDVR
jgi:hypothetical protein